MSKGTISANILNRSITRHVVKKDNGIIRGAGGDFAAFNGSEVMLSASGFCEDGTVYDLTPGVLAEVIAENNLSTAGAEPEYMNIFITAGEACTEDKLRREMSELTSLAKDRKIAVIGGNTAYAGDGEGYSVTVNLLGEACDKKAISFASTDPRREARAGDYVIVSGYAGHFGVSQLIKSKREFLEKRFSKSFLDEALMDPADYRISMLDGLYLMHDISYGGVYRALYDLSEWTGLGISIIHEELPIRQDTIEICEVLDINPYCLFGVGVMTGLCHEAELEKIRSCEDFETGKLHIAGRLTEQKEKIVTSAEYRMKRFLTPYDRDEIYIKDIREIEKKR